MDTGAIIIFVVFGLIIIYLVDKNFKMMKYRKLYEDALKSKNKVKALEYGRLYHRYRTSGKTKASTSAELIIANDMKAAGIN
jgi:hypothetical protein